MLKKLLKNKKLTHKIKNFYNENKDEIVDIVLFGSLVKGKDKPKDIDILILFREKENLELDYKLKKILPKNFQITSKTYKGLLEPTFIAREAFLSEGYSLIFNKNLSEGLGYSSWFLFRYSLKKFNKSNRMRFYYALYGRKKEDAGMLKETKSIKFSESIILSPKKNSEKIKEFLDQWGIVYISFPVLIPKRIVDSKIFK